jgi:hypothetical protein
MTGWESIWNLQEMSVEIRLIAVTFVSEFELEKRDQLLESAMHGTNILAQFTHHGAQKVIVGLLCTLHHQKTRLFRSKRAVSELERSD